MGGVEMGQYVLDDFKKWLFAEWYKLPKGKYTYPFLKRPTEEYCKSKITVLVLDRETNGWGQKEHQQDDSFPTSAISTGSKKALTSRSSGRRKETTGTTGEPRRG